MCPLGIEAALLLDTQRSLLCVLPIFAPSFLSSSPWYLSLGRSPPPPISSSNTTGGKKSRRLTPGSACCGTASPLRQLVAFWHSSRSTWPTPVACTSLASVSAITPSTRGWFPWHWAWSRVGSHLPR